MPMLIFRYDLVFLLLLNNKGQSELSSFLSSSFGSYLNGYKQKLCCKSKKQSNFNMDSFYLSHEVFFQPFKD